MPHTSTHLIQLPAEALKNVVLVDLENRLALVEDGMHDHAQRVHVGGGVTADGQDVFRSQVLRVGEAERRKVGLPFFTRVLGLKRVRTYKDVTILHSIILLQRFKGSHPAHLSFRGVCGGDAEVKAHDLPGSTLVEDDVLWTQVAVDHFHPAVEKGQTLRDLKGTEQ